MKVGEDVPIGADEKSRARRQLTCQLLRRPYGFRWRRTAARDGSLWRGFPSDHSRGMLHDRRFELAYPLIGTLVNSRPIVLEVPAASVTNRHRFSCMGNFNNDCIFIFVFEGTWPTAGAQ